MKQTQRTMLHHTMMLLTTLAAILGNLAVVPAQELTPTPAARVEHTTGDQSPIIHTESGDVQLSYGISPELFAEYVKKLALTEDTVERFFKVLAQEQVPREEWDSTLQEIAAQYKELLRRLEFVQSEDPQVKELKEQARQAINDLLFEDAEQCLNQAEVRDLQAIEQLQKDIQERQAALVQRQLSAAETNADNARLQRIQLRYARAAEYWRQAAQLLPESEQPKRGEYLNAAGYDFHRVARYDDALSLFEQSLAISQEIGDRVGEGATLNNLGQIYAARGDYATALQYLEQSLAIRQEIGDKAGEGQTLNNLATTAYAVGDYATALPYLEQSLAISQEIGDKAGEGTTLNNLGQIYAARGDDATALPYLEQSLAISQEIGDKAGEGTTLNNLSQIYAARGDDATALQYYEQSLAISQEIGDKAGEGTTLNNLGQIYAARDDDATALQYYEQSLAIRQEIGDKAGEGATLNNIGLIYRARGDNDTALPYLDQSLAIHREIGDRAGEGRTLNNISGIYWAQGDNAMALQYLEQSLEIQQEIGDIAGMCGTLFNMGHIHYQREEEQEAFETWVMVYRLAKPRNLAQALDALENLAAELGLPGELSAWETLGNQTSIHNEIQGVTDGTTNEETR